MCNVYINISIKSRMGSKSRTDNITILLPCIYSRVADRHMYVSSSIVRYYVELTWPDALKSCLIDTRLGSIKKCNKVHFPTDFNEWDIQSYSPKK